MTDALDRLDLLDLDDELDEEDRLLRDTVRKFADDRLRPNIRQWFEDGVLPARELAREFGELGMLGMHLHGYGCQGADAVAVRAGVRRDRERRLRAALAGQRAGLAGDVRHPRLRQRGAEAALAAAAWPPGEALGCFGLTEPDAGSDPGAMRTRARRDGDDWVLNGTKMWITNGSVADVAVVWARTEEGVRGFLVEPGTPGFTAQDVHHKLSLRASVTSELVLDEVRLPAAAVLPGARGLRAPLGCLTEARFGIVCGVTGAARDALAATLDYAGTRTQFGRPIAAFQLTQRKLAELAVQLQQMQLTARRLGELKDAGRIAPHQVSFGKFANVRAALEICREARSVLGGSGITTEYPVLRHALNLETVYTYEGTHEVHMLVLGSRLTGLDAFR